MLTLRQGPYPRPVHTNVLPDLQVTRRVPQETLPEGPDLEPGRRRRSRGPQANTIWFWIFKRSAAPPSTTSSCKLRLWRCSTTTSSTTPCCSSTCLKASGRRHVRRLCSNKPGRGYYFRPPQGRQVGDDAQESRSPCWLDGPRSQQLPEQRCVDVV